MRQAGVTEAPLRERRARAWVDFGVDETWEPARPTRTRRERRVDSWVDDADLFAPRYEDDVEPARSRPVREDVGRPARRDAVARSRADSPREVTGPQVRIADATWTERPVGARGDATIVERDAVAVSVDVIAHPAHVPTPVPAPADPADETAAALSPPAAGAGSAVAGGGVAGRRTVTIRGRGAERDLAFPEPGRARRPPVRRHERPGFKPDRTALWALVLGVALVLVAATSSHAAALSHSRPAAQCSPARVAHVAPSPAARALVLRAQH